MRHIALLGLLALVFSSCGDGTIMEEDGQGGVFSTNGAVHGVFQDGVRVGDTRSSGNVVLCLSASDQEATLASVQPDDVFGDVRVDRIAVRTVLRPPSRGDQDADRYMVGTMEGSPTNLRAPRGYEVPNDCSGGAESEVAEIVMTLTKTGPVGGAIEGLRITYEWRGETHEFVTPVTFGLCGSATEEWCA